MYAYDMLDIQSKRALLYFYLSPTMQDTYLIVAQLNLVSLESVIHLLITMMRVVVRI